MAIKMKARKDTDVFCNPSPSVVAQIFHTSKHFRMLYNIRPLDEGHSLIITNRHVLGLMDLNPHEVKELFNLLPGVIRMNLDVYNEGERAYDIKIRSGVASGRTIDHFHLHLIPRHRRVDAGPSDPDRFVHIYEKSLQQKDRPNIDYFAEEAQKLKTELKIKGHLKHILRDRSSAKELRSTIPADIAENVFIESKYFVAAHNTNPILPGHSLILPKREVSDFLDLTRRELNDFAHLYPVVMNSLLKMYGDETNSYITAMQVGGYIGMPVNRLHMHLLPRTLTDIYAGNDDLIYYDIFEKDYKFDVMQQGDIKDAVASLKRSI